MWSSGQTSLQRLPRKLERGVFVISLFLLAMCGLGTGNWDGGDHFAGLSIIMLAMAFGASLVYWGKGSADVMLSSEMNSINAIGPLNFVKHEQTPRSQSIQRPRSILFAAGQSSRASRRHRVQCLREAGGHGSPRRSSTADVGLVGRVKPKSKQTAKRGGRVARDR